MDMLGRIQAVWDKLGGKGGVDRFLRGEITVSEPTRLWREEDGVIYFRVTSDGTTGEEWARRLEEKSFRVGSGAESLLCSANFKPTSGVTTEVAVLKGILFGDNGRITRMISAEAARRKFTTPKAEVACLIREKFTDAEIESMGLAWIVVMHKPIKDSLGGWRLLLANRLGSGRLLGAYFDEPDRWWRLEDGFAFAVSQRW